MCKWDEMKQARFEIFSVGIREQRYIVLQNKANGILNHLNYPQPQPSNIDFTQHIVAPLGEVILLEVHNVGISEADCHSLNRIEVRNAYYFAHTKSLVLLLMTKVSLHIFRFTIAIQI